VYLDVLAKLAARDSSWERCLGGIAQIWD